MRHIELLPAQVIMRLPDGANPLCQGSAEAYNLT